MVRTSGTAVVPSPAKTEVAQSAATLATKVTLRLESKGRSGKTVTRILGLPPARLEEIGAQMRRALGCGAVIETPDLVLLGSLTERAAEWLRKTGARQVVMGTAPVRIPATADRFTAPMLADTCSTGRVVATNPRTANERSQIRRGQRVAIVLKADQGSGALTEGVVQDVLTRSATHPHGIKVRLESGLIGRVKKLLG